MREEDRDNIRAAELQVEQTVLRQVVAAVPVILSGVISWAKRKLTGSSAMVMLAVLLLPIAAMAADGGTANNAVVQVLGNYVIPTLAAALLMLLTAIAKVVYQRYGITIDNAFIREVVHATEAYGIDYLKQHGSKLPSSESLSYAIGLICDYGSTRLKSMSQPELERKINATVNHLFNWGRSFEVAPGSVRSNIDTPEA